MNEASARAVLLLQAFETAQPPSPSWSDDDRAWATRLALDAAAPDAETFIAQRARHAMQRLAPREPAAASWLARRLWRARWVGWAVLAGLVVGALADSIGSGQRINLLAPPLWAVLAWNALVYLVLLGHGLARLLMRPTRPGSLVLLTQRLLRLGRRLPGPGAASASADGPSGSARALQAFATGWLRASAPLAAARASTLLHAAAAALALGLIAGMYLRGLVLDYRVAWESTFLSAETAHAALAALLAPAVAISGIALPDAAGFEALRAVHGGAAASASAAPWIHLLALTLLLFVVLPRSALALGAALRAHWLARHIALPLADAYFQRLARLQRGDVAHVVVQPYAATPSAQAALGLRSLLAPALGDGLQLRVAPTAAFGAEDADDSAAALDAGTTLAIALFDLAATPEAESQGRFAQQLAQRAPAGAATILLVDEAGFRQRFGADSARLAQRRDAWRVFGEALGTLPVCVDLGAPDVPGATRALQLALRSPLNRGTA
ncbi:MAG TPA: DUF2868 domain-containing protein [Burkholderiaceae bacterium]|nr:DUF2868 domain-containing protein [Burkholderiaceae bacterium]